MFPFFLSVFFCKFKPSIIYERLGLFQFCQELESNVTDLYIYIILAAIDQTHEQCVLFKAGAVLTFDVVSCLLSDPGQVRVTQQNKQKKRFKKKSGPCMLHMRKYIIY